MSKLFKDLTETCKVIFDDDDFAYFKCNDVEESLSTLDTAMSSDKGIPTIVRETSRIIKQTSSLELSSIENAIYRVYIHGGMDTIAKCDEIVVKEKT